MKVDGHIDVGVEGVLVEENRATCIMGHVEHVTDASCKEMTCHLPAICFSEASSFPRGCVPWVPVVDAEPLLHR